MYKNIPEIMTFKECQQLLKIGKNTLLDLIHNGELDAFKIGNRWKITKEACSGTAKNFV
jgi:excisionase family DNA binding protein